jgi:AraC family transcriptional regulator
MGLRLGSGCFYGDLSKSCEASGFRLTELVHPPEQQTHQHSHERAYFSLTLSGTYTKLYGRRVVKCTPRTLVFHPPGQTQSGFCDAAGARSFIVELAPPALDFLSRTDLLTDGVSLFHNGPLLWTAAKLYEEFRHMDELSPLAVEGLSLTMTAEAARASKEVARRDPPRWLERAREILHARFNGDLTVAGVAQEVGVHPVYLAVEFRRFYRSAPAEYIRRLRVESACRALSGTAAPLIEIALAAGFSSQSHFSTTFKRLTGMTPTEYRAAFRAP